MSDEQARQMLDQIREARWAIEAQTVRRDQLIKQAADARISHREIMDAASLKRTRVHEIIHEK